MSRLTRSAKNARSRSLSPADRVRIEINSLGSVPLDKVELTWDRGKSPYPPGFYTYLLIDPRSQRPFYVGKGQRARAWQHERLVVAGDLSGNAQKVARIQSILSARAEVAIEIVGIYKHEADALEHEFKLVDELPDLTNIMPGGIGAAQTPQLLERRRLYRSLKLEEARERDRVAALARDTERKRSRLLSLPNADRHAAEINAWVDGLAAKGKRLRLTPKPSSSRRSKQDLHEHRAGVRSELWPDECQ